MNFFQSMHLSHFSSPPENRVVYQAVNRAKPKTILEFGIQRGVRSVNVLELAKRFHKTSEIKYCCVDPFELRSVEDGPGLSLRKAYKMLAKTGVRVLTVPGSPGEGLRHLSDTIQNVDLMIVATPSLEWTSVYAPDLTGLVGPDGIVFMGTSTPSGKPFEMKKYAVEEFRSLHSPIRRAA